MSALVLDQSLPSGLFTGEMAADAHAARTVPADASALTGAVNPYRIEGPAFISFSGGRTSAYMLKKIVDAYDGILPSNIHVGFANTGKERPETLRFVHECSVRWGVPISWVEWRATPTRAAGTKSLAAWLEAKDPDRRMVNAAGFDLVGYNSASRNGEPFEALIELRQRLPNWKERWCTVILKLEPLFAFAASLGLQRGLYTEVIGLRHDEALRIFKGMANAEKFGSRVAYPLSKAKVTKADVMAFWREQPFDLGLQPFEGNCDLCFMKGRGLRKRIIRDDPSIGTWWSNQEIKRDQFFDRRDRVRALQTEVRTSPEFNDEFEADEEYDAECGLHCGDDDS